MRHTLSAALAAALFALTLLTGCNDNAAKGVNKDKDRPKAPEPAKADDAKK